MSCLLLGLALSIGAGCAADETGQRDTSTTVQVAGDTQPATAARPALPALTAEEVAHYQDLARAAWQYLDKHYQPSTGFVKATPEWANTTLWDVGGQLLAYHAARELGLLAPEEYTRRTTRLLETLERLPLFRNAAYNKTYTTKDGQFGDGRQGWSATDLGRFLLGLHIIKVREPRFAAQIDRVVNRIDFKQVVKDGYVHGQLIGSKGQPWTFQEGRIGYEQYVAAGFAPWGQDVRNALSVGTNAKPVKVLGVDLVRDGRGLDRLLSEPFILYGLEVGMPEDVRRLAEQLLQVQEARYRQTGKMTIVTEDAVGVPPHYFYYYCAYCNGKPFVVDISSPGQELDSPRWVSTKGAYGWHALMPNEYTQKAVAHVAAAKDPARGWSSGVYEDNGKSTMTWDVNTAAVLMEIAYYQLRGRKPHIEPGPVSARATR